METEERDVGETARYTDARRVPEGKFLDLFGCVDTSARNGNGIRR